MHFRSAVKRMGRRNIARLASYSGFTAVWNNAVAGKGIRILAYHGIEPDPKNDLAVSCDNFERQMRYLKENFHVLNLSSAYDLFLDGKGIHDDIIVLTFDDGYSNFWEFAYPILFKYRLPATIFVIADRLQSGGPRFMDISTVCRLAESPLVSVGSHSLNHLSMAQIPPDVRLWEINESKRILERILGQPVDHFCYPYGTRNDISEACERDLREGGYRLACSSLNGINVDASRPFRLRRTKVESGDDMRTFVRLLHGSLDVWYLVDLSLPFLQRPAKHEMGR